MSRGAGRPTITAGGSTIADTGTGPRTATSAAAEAGGLRHWSALQSSATRSAGTRCRTATDITITIIISADGAALAAAAITAGRAAEAGAATTEAVRAEITEARAADQAVPARRRRRHPRQVCRAR